MHITDSIPRGKLLWSQVTHLRANSHSPCACVLHLSHLWDLAVQSAASALPWADRLAACRRGQEDKEASAVDVHGEQVGVKLEQQGLCIVLACQLQTW